MAYYYLEFRVGERRGATTGHEWASALVASCCYMYKDPPSMRVRGNVSGFPFKSCKSVYSEPKIVPFQKTFHYIALDMDTIQRWTAFSDVSLVGLSTKKRFAKL
jgi:hypothetical protein